MLVMIMTPSVMKTVLLKWHKWPTTDHYHLRDAEPTAIRNISIDAMTETYASVQMPAQIGPNQHGSLRCKVDTCF